MYQRQYKIRSKKEEQDFELKYDANAVTREEKKMTYGITDTGHNSFLVVLGSRRYEVDVINQKGSRLELSINGKNLFVHKKDELAETLATIIGEVDSSVDSASVESPMPGKVVKYLKKVGDAIQPGDSLLILEAMKMENVIKSDSSGSIQSLPFEEGATVQKGDVLVQF